jgi:hypothetical protein
MKVTLRWSALLVSLIAVSAVGLFLSDAFGKQRRGSSRDAVARNTPIRNTPIYTTGGFTFSAPLQLPKPIPNPSLFFIQDAEPEIKIDIFGNIYVTAINGVPGGTDLWKSTDKGSTFLYLGQPDGAQDKCLAPLPECLALGGADDAIDVSTGGYLYVTSLYAGSVNVSTSMDGGVGGIEPGQAWQLQPVGSVVPVDDRQWVAAYGPQTLYMTMRQAPGTGRLFFFKSTDAGKTFLPSAANPLTTIVSREGNLVVDPYNGNLYTTFTTNGATNQISLLRSLDGGNTWSTIPIYTGPAGTDLNNAFPMLAVDRGGNLHLAFAQSLGISPSRTSCHVYLMSTANPAALVPTWTTPVQVDNGPLNNTALMPWIVGGSPGVVDITWYGSTVSSPDVTPNSNKALGQWWKVFFAQATNVFSGSPVFNQVVVANDVHNLAICSSGTGCVTSPTSTSTRKLLEYYTMTVDPEGNANIAFPDSVDNCPSSSCLTNTWFAKQTNGASAYSPPLGPPLASFASNVALPNSTTKAEPSLAVDSFNCIYASAPGGANIWKSVNAGASFAKLPNVPVLPTGGGDEDLLTLPATIRPATIYYADLALADVSIRKSINGAGAWTSPGVGGSAGELNASSDRQWIAWDFNGPAQNIYEMDHELVSEDIRFASSTDDSPWVTVSGITDPGLLTTTLPNTNPGPVFVNHTDHTVYGVFTASSPTTNANRPPFGKLPDVWIAAGAGTLGAGLAPGPFTDYPAFKGVIDSPTMPAPPAGATTYGTNTANDFPGGDIDAAGNVYVAWAMNNARTNQYAVWLASSHDGGKNFYGPFQISSGPGSAEMPWIAAGDAGKINVVFYSTNGLGDPNTTSLQWNVMMAQSLNASAREPSFTVSQVSDHITHFGPICNLGLLCASGTRVLLDYFEVAIGPDGLANIVFADTGNANAPSHVTYARQIGGALVLNNPTSPTCLAGTSINPINAVSRKTHGSVGDFDVDLPLIGGAGVECRTGGPNGDHKVIINFANAVSVGGASVASSDGQAMVSSFSVNGPVVTVNLTKVTNAQTITISLTNVSDGTNIGNVSLPMGVLEGDTTANRAVNSSDISQTQSQSGQEVTSDNFREDVTVNGLINSSDIALVQSRSGTALP